MNVENLRVYYYCFSQIIMEDSGKFVIKEVVNKNFMEFIN